jgi:hypothetical protein
MVRAGSHGEEEQIALDNNLVSIEWNEIPDLRNNFQKYQNPSVSSLNPPQ